MGPYAGAGVWRNLFTQSVGYLLLYDIIRDYPEITRVHQSECCLKVLATLMK